MLLAIAGCASPSPRMSAAERQDVVVDGSAFTVFRVGDAVEVYRTSAQFMPHLSVVVANAEKAIGQATGCKVREGSMIGDAALLKATLDCSEAPAS